MPLIPDGGETPPCTKVWSWWVWGQEASEPPLQWLALATACDGRRRGGQRQCPGSELAWGEHPPSPGLNETLFSCPIL